VSRNQSAISSAVSSIWGLLEVFGWKETDCSSSLASSQVEIRVPLHLGRLELSQGFIRSYLRFTWRDSFRDDAPPNHASMKNTPNELDGAFASSTLLRSCPCTVMVDSPSYARSPCSRDRARSIRVERGSPPQLSSVTVISSRRGGSIGFVLIGVLRRCLVPARSTM
jgi:hypothetical protein